MTANITPEQELQLDQKFGTWDWRAALKTAEPVRCPAWCDSSHDSKDAFSGLVDDDEVCYHEHTLAKVHDFEIKLYMTQAHSSWKQEPGLDVTVWATGNWLAETPSSRSLSDLDISSLDALAGVPGIHKDLIEGVERAKVRLSELSRRGAAPDAEG